MCVSHVCVCMLGLSTWLPLRNKSVVVSAANKDTPVFMGHGNADPIVSVLTACMLVCCCLSVPLLDQLTCCPTWPVHIPCSVRCVVGGWVAVVCGWWVGLHACQSSTHVPYIAGTVHTMQRSQYSLAACLPATIKSSIDMLLQVQYEFGVASCRKLESVGAKVEMETYSGMGHSVSDPWAMPLQDAADYIDPQERPLPARYGGCHLCVPDIRPYACL